jgi:putative transposase
MLAYCLTTCRYLYNELLEDRKNAYDRCGVGLNYNEQAGQLKYPNLGIYSQVPPDVLRRLDKAFQNFFRRVKNGEKKAGYTRFQGKNRYACTIKQEGNQWYVCFSVELPDPEPKEITTSVGVGVDVGITTLATLSDGNGSAVDAVGVTEIENPKTLNKYDSKLRKAQRTLSRNKKGSSNRNKQRIVLAGVYRKVINARKDCLHKARRILADTYDRIVFEDLQIKNMVKNHNLARSISDTSWGMLLNFTTYKAEYAGGSVQLVNPRNTSKQCSVCGHIQDMPLSQRIYQCPNCGNVTNRDVNGDINIKNRYVRADCPELTPVEMVA